MEYVSHATISSKYKLCYIFNPSIWTKTVLLTANVSTVKASLQVQIFGSLNFYPATFNVIELLNFKTQFRYLYQTKALRHILTYGLCTTLRTCIAFWVGWDLCGLLMLLNYLVILSTTAETPRRLPFWNVC